MRRTAMAGAVWLALCASAAAQTPPPDRPGPYVIDVRGVLLSLPRDAAFFPPMPSSTAVPSRGYGIDLGAHVYLVQLGAARLGIGAILVRARGTASASAGEDEEGGSRRSGPPATPDMAALITSAAPQVSLNFGSRDGWSYLSAGLGRTWISTRASAFAGDDDDEVTGARLIDAGGRSTIDFGGGARWFAKPRVAFSFDVRFHVVGAGRGPTPTPRTTLVAAAVGLSVR